MAITTTLADVKLIILLSAKVDDTVWQALLDDATAWMIKLDIEADCGTATADLVTKYLAAHFMTIRDPRRIERDVDGAKEKFSDDFGLGLDASRYGQQAKRMDCSGKLARADKDVDADDEIKPVHIFKAMGR